MASDNDFEERVELYEQLWRKAYDEGTPRHLPASDATLKELLQRNRHQRVDSYFLLPNQGSLRHDSMLPNADGNLPPP